jgi:ATP-dependent exoDNAse (exonuclease V) beta subunit
MRLILKQVPNFTTPQVAAIDIARLGQDACIVAGPGSGKTTVLVERYRQLVEAGVLPREILAITFTEKAAANMKDKMVKAFSGQPEIRRQIEAAYISTVHGFCQRLLKENAIAAGVDPQFAILDERQGQIRRARCAVETLDTFLREWPAETGALMAAIEQPDLAGPLVEVHDAIRSAGVSFEELGSETPSIGDALASISTFVDEYRRFTGKFTDRQREYRDDLVEWAATARAAYRDEDWRRLTAATAEFKFQSSRLHRDWKADFEEAKRPEDLLGAVIVKLYADERRTLIEILRRFDRLYAQEKQKLGVLDFSDLEHFAIRLLEEHAPVRDRVQAQFRQILMDEYQDTNGQQARLLQLLRGRGNFYAVGDINQSIFGFRYATPEVFRRHREAVETAHQHHVELFDNFRSRTDILRAVEAVLEGAPGVESRDLHARRNLPLKEVPSVEVTAARAETADQASRVEAEWIASRILELRGSLTVGDDSRPADFRDMAVLVRKTSLVGPLMEAFDRFGVAYQVTRQIGFFEAREIRDLTHLLRAISNPRDEVSLAVVLRSPFAGLSDEGLLRLKPGVDNLAGALEGDVAGLDSLDVERFQLFRANFARWRSTANWLPADQLLTAAMADCGYQWIPGSAAGNNIEKLLALARNARRDQSLAEFVHEIHLIREEDAREADAPFDEALDAVRVITAHASKGLEFPIVFIPGMESRMAVHLPDLTFTTAGGLGTKWRNPSGGDAVADWFRTRNKEVIRRREKDESDRLLYVAMTRAEEHLVLSYAVGEKDKPHDWAEAVSRVFAMESLQPDAPARVISAGLPGSEFAAAVRSITRTPAAVPVERVGAFAGNIQEIARPVVAGEEESSVTVTALTLFADCPRRYYLARYLGWESDARKPSPSSELGRQVHALLAGQDVPAPDLEALRLADTFDRSALGRRVRKARHVEHEFDVMFALGGMVLRGQIDLWFEDRAGQILVDYKTDDIAAADAEARAASYELQLRYYAMAIEKVTGALPTEAWLHFLRPDVPVKVDLARRHLDLARELVDELAAAQRENRFPLKEGAHCTRCPFYRGKCPAE